MMASNQSGPEVLCTLVLSLSASRQFASSGESSTFWHFDTVLGTFAPGTCIPGSNLVWELLLWNFRYNICSEEFSPQNFCSIQMISRDLEISNGCIDNRRWIVYVDALDVCVRFHINCFS